MERNNHLSDNLRAYQREREQTLSEFSRELGIAKSTLQSVMADGNATVDTLIRMANALGVSLDELVFDRIPPTRLDKIHYLISELNWYMRLPAQKQDLFRSYLTELFHLLQDNP